ncbi:hypothetical protein D3C80_1654270 [compost metagenome]
MFGSNGVTAGSMFGLLEFRLMLEEMVLVVFGARFDWSIFRSLSTPLMILPLASTP